MEVRPEGHNATKSKRFRRLQLLLEIGVATDEAMSGIGQCRVPVGHVPPAKPVAFGRNRADAGQQLPSGSLRFAGRLGTDRLDAIGLQLSE